MPWRENKGVANLNGIYTDGLGLLRKKSLEEIFLKEWPEARNNYGSTEDTEGTELYTSIGRMITKIFK